MSESGKQGKPAKAKRDLWPVWVSIVTFSLTLLISWFSETVLGNSGIVVAALVLLTLIFINVLFDMIGVAVTAADQTPFVAMAAKKVPGGRAGMWMIRSADRISNVCSDVIGDICGILSGTAGIMLVTIGLAGGLLRDQMWANILVSSLAAALTVSGKAVGKSVGIRYSHEIVLICSKAIAPWVRGGNGSGNGSKKAKANGGKKKLKEKARQE